MRTWAMLLLLCAAAWPAFAAKTLTVDQMEQLLAGLQGKPDGKVAGELDNVQLSERVSPARLARWEAEFPGSRAREELLKLSDLSVFLDPPAADVLRDPAPDAETQVQMLTLSAKYVRNTIARLPDFYASRNTTHFESLVSQSMDYSMGSTGAGTRSEQGSLRTLTVHQVGVDNAVEIESLHNAGRYSASVTYRDGHEVPGDDAETQKSRPPRLGLTSSGEFGPILAVVLGDALQSSIGWQRWEQGPGGPEAVFHFQVPESKSHFAVNIVEGNQTLTIVPAYHGEMEIDPATGEILRLSQIADMAPPHQAMRAAILVEFAPVTIGGRSYICPLRSVAFSRSPAPNAGGTEDSQPMQTELNDVAFTHYHEFRADVRIVPNEVAGGSVQPAPPPVPALPPAADTASMPVPGPASAPASSPTSSSISAPSPAPAQEASATPASNPAPAAPAPAAAIASTASAAAPETTSAANAPSPATPELAAPAPASPAASAAATNVPLPASTVLHTTSQLVLVDVVVTDHDRPMQGLARGRFHIFEDGREQPLASFDEHEPAAQPAPAAPPALPPDTYSNQPTYSGAGAVNVLLLDALNTPAADQEQVRRTMIRYLGSIRPGTSLAVFTLSSRLRMAAGFTTDVPRLLQVLESQGGKPGAAAGVGSGRGENMSTDIEHAASSINTDSDPGTIWLVSQIMNFAADMNTYDTDQRVTRTLEAFSQLGRYLAAIPGRKNVIWFSGSFPIGLGPGQGMRTPANDLRDYSRQVEQTGQLLAAARVAVYPVDARGLMNAPGADATYLPPPTFPSPGQSPDRAAAAVNNEDRSFAAQASQEKGAMDSIAAETGGRVFSTGNDLMKAIAKIMDSDSSYYTLSYVPPESGDASRGAVFHRIEVKVDGGYQLAYRRGYSTGNAPAPPAGSGAVPRQITEAAVLGAPPSTQILFAAQVLPQNGPQPGAPTAETALAAGPASATNRPAGAEASGLNGAGQRYIVDLSVDPAKLTFAQSADGARHAQVQCALVAYNADGQEVNSLGRSLDVNLPAEQLAQLETAGKGIPVRLALDLPPGRIVLRIVVFDPASARTGSLEVPLAVAAAASR